MDAIIDQAECADGLLARALELRLLSRHGSPQPEHFFKLCGLYHQLGSRAYCEQTHQLTLAIANALLQERELRELTLAHANSLPADVQRRLREPLLQLEWEQPLWRILFLLAHGQDLANSTAKFDKDLAPLRFVDLVEQLPSADGTALSCALAELGKYWYALCYNYGSVLQSNRERFWAALERFNLTISANSGMLERYHEPLLQLSSLVLLFPENQLASTLSMVFNIMRMLKVQVAHWARQVSCDLYSSLDDYKIPQILHLLDLYVLKSPQPVRERAAPCFCGDQNVTVDLQDEVLELMDSSMSSTHTRNAVANVLSSLHLTIIDTPAGAQQVVPIDSPTSPANSLFSDAARASANGDSSDLNVSSQSTLCNSGSNPTDVDEKWSDEEKDAEAARIMGIIKRLNELGVVKTPGN